MTPNWLDTYEMLDLMLGRTGIKHFQAREFTRPSVHKGVVNQPVPERYMDNICVLARLLERIRADFGGAPVFVLSGYRSPSYNKTVGGSTYSQHMYGRAADIQVLGVRPKEVFDWMEKHMPTGGRGRYRTWTHVDVRPKYARWIKL